MELTSGEEGTCGILLNLLGERQFVVGVEVVQRGWLVQIEPTLVCRGVHERGIGVANCVRVFTASVVTEVLRHSVQRVGSSNITMSTTVTDFSN